MGEQGYTSRQVAALTGLPMRRICALARAGVLAANQAVPRRPRGVWRFSFNDVRLLRTASGLLQTGLGPKQVWRTLVGLRHQAQASRQPLSGTTLVNRGDRVLACDGQTMWDTTDGQILLWYAPPGAEGALAEPAAAAPMVAPVLPHQGGTEAADVWFEHGLRAQEENPVAAYGAYLNALACDPMHVEAAINIGRLCSMDRDLRRASRYFRLAAQLDPEHAVAQYNLAVTLHNLGQLRAAVSAYQRALALDPDSEDARINLGQLLREETT